MTDTFRNIALWDRGSDVINFSGKGYQKDGGRTCEDLVRRLLDPRDSTRCDVAEAKAHPLFSLGPDVIPEEIATRTKHNIEMLKNGGSAAGLGSSSVQEPQEDDMVPHDPYTSHDSLRNGVDGAHRWTPADAQQAVWCSVNETHFNWRSMAVQALPPPFVPMLKGATDLKNFRVGQVRMPPEIPYEKEKDKDHKWADCFADLELLPEGSLLHRYEQV